MFKSLQGRLIGIILALSLTMTIVLSLNTGMDMRQDGFMSGCIFDQSVACPMGYQEHVRYWQQAFIATEPVQMLTFAALFVVVLGTAFPSFQKQLSQEQAAHHVQKHKRRQREIVAKLFDALLHAFSRGILNSKLYNFSYFLR